MTSVDEAGDGEESELAATEAKHDRVTREVESQLHRAMQLLFHRKMLVQSRIGAIKTVIANEAAFYARDFGVQGASEATMSAAALGAGVVDRRTWAARDAAARGPGGPCVRGARTSAGPALQAAGDHTDL